MVSMDGSAVSVLEWKQSFLEEIEGAPDTTTKGNLFVQRVLCSLYGYSMDDAIDATAFAGAGDHGVDALTISEPIEEGARPEARVIQGKFGQAGVHFSPYEESKKFIDALRKAHGGQQVTGAIDRCASVLHNDGLVRYVIATIEPLSSTQMSQINDVRVLAHNYFPDRLVIETVSLDDLHDALVGPATPNITVRLSARGVQPTPDTFVGVASLVEIYEMMRQYAQANHNNVDAIYDLHVRKWLKKRAGSVNYGIYQTLEKTPERFLAFNNGITLVCRTLRVAEGVLELVDPYIVNGCQTTRTLYDFIDTKFAGIWSQLATDSKAKPYHEAFLAFKVIAHPDDPYRKDITRYSNKQNALRGKDFLSLEDTFKRLKKEMQQHGYFLQVQAGEYDALPKHTRDKYPRATHVIDAFDALRYYAAAVLNKPHTAFGRSGEFAPDGDEFDRTMEGITVDDLFVPWVMAQEARKLGYSEWARSDATPQNEHRNQTRYFYLYILFHIAAAILFDREDIVRDELYRALLHLRQDREALVEEQRKQHSFTQLLSIADQCVKTYMTLARKGNWYTDRNAFLKSVGLLNPANYIQATAGPLTNTDELQMMCRAILANQ